MFDLVVPRDGRVIFYLRPKFDHPLGHSFYHSVLIQEKTLEQLREQSVFYRASLGQPKPDHFPHVFTVQACHLLDWLFFRQTVWQLLQLLHTLRHSNGQLVVQELRIFEALLR